MVTLRSWSSENSLTHRGIPREHCRPSGKCSHCHCPLKKVKEKLVQAKFVSIGEQNYHCGTCGDYHNTVNRPAYVCTNTECQQTHCTICAGSRLPYPEWEEVAVNPDSVTERVFIADDEVEWMLLLYQDSLSFLATRFSVMVNLLPTQREIRITGYQKDVDVAVYLISYAKAQKATPDFLWTLLEKSEEARVRAQRAALRQLGLNEKDDSGFIMVENDGTEVTLESLARDDEPDLHEKISGFLTEEEALQIETLRNEFEKTNVTSDDAPSTAVLDQVGEAMGINAIQLNSMPPLDSDRWERLSNSICKIRSAHFVKSYRKLFPTSDMTDEVRRRIANMTLKEAEREIILQASASAIQGSAVTGRADFSTSMAN